VFFDFSDFYFPFLLILNGLLQKILNYRLGTVNEKHWGFKPVFRCSKPHTYSTFIGEEIENQIYSYMFFLGYLEHGKCKQQQHKQVYLKSREKRRILSTHVNSM